MEETMNPFDDLNETLAVVARGVVDSDWNKASEAITVFLFQYLPVPGNYEDIRIGVLTLPG
jgi:hypothetical protein